MSNPFYRGIKGKFKNKKKCLKRESEMISCKNN